MQLEAIKQNENSIQFIRNLSEKIIRYVIENFGNINVIQSMRVDFDRLPDGLKLLLELKFQDDDKKLIIEKRR